MCFRGVCHLFSPIVSEKVVLNLHIKSLEFIELEGNVFIAGRYFILNVEMCIY